MVVISNGFKNFHMVMAGAEADSRKNLTMYIAGAYPTQKILNSVLMRMLSRFFNMSRFLARKESINDQLVRSKWLPEVLQMLSLKMANYKYLVRVADFIHVLSFKWYAHLAVKDIREAHDLGARIYHYRAGFGHRSAKVAKELGMVTLCDHSIVHPASLQYMIDNGGEMPSVNTKTVIDYFWKTVLDDFQWADAILVNSEFVKSTFISQGLSGNDVHVAYLGVDTPFLKHIAPVAKKEQDHQVVGLMFAGLFGERKGADILIESLLNLTDISWRLDIAGSVSPYVKRKYSDFLNDSRVNLLGTLSRDKLAEKMMESDVFVFPSLAEGSARVIFEAMACGCYVITTPNSGSIVETGIHGELVSTADSIGLSGAIIFAANNIQTIRDIGNKNAQLIQDKYLQKYYGDTLDLLYKNLVEKHDKR